MHEGHYFNFILFSIIFGLEFKDEKDFKNYRKVLIWQNILKFKKLKLKSTFSWIRTQDKLRNKQCDEMLELK